MVAVGHVVRVRPERGTVLGPRDEDEARVNAVATITVGAAWRWSHHMRPVSAGGYGCVSLAQTLSSIRLTGQKVADPPKSSAPAANTLAPAGVS